MDENSPLRKMLENATSKTTFYPRLHMVRAGVVTHPSDWKFSGYNEIQNPCQRYELINYKRLMQLMNFQTVEKLKKSHNGWIEEAL